MLSILTQILIIDAARAGNLLPDDTKSLPFYTESNIQASFLTLDQRDMLKKDIGQLYEDINDMENSNDDVDFSFEKQILEDLPRKINHFTVIESCATNNFFTDIKRRFDHSLNFMQLLKMRSRKKRQTDIADLAKRDRAKMLEIFGLWNTFKDTTKTEQERQDSLDQIYTSLSNNRIITKKDSIVKFLEFINIININSNLTRAGLVQLFVKSVKSKFNFSPSHVNHIDLRPRTSTEQPPEFTTASNPDECIDSDEKTIQLTADMGGAFYILRTQEWSDDLITNTNNILDDFATEIKDKLDADSCNFINQNCNRFIPDPDKYRLVEKHMLIDSSLPEFDRKLISIFLNLRENCLDSLTNRNHQDLKRLTQRADTLSRRSIENNNALLAILGQKARSYAIFTEFDIDDGFERIASLLSLSQPELEEGLIDWRVKRVTTKVDRSVKNTLLVEFNTVYDFIEDKLTQLKSNQLKPALEDLKIELNEAMSSLEEKLKKDISRIKRNDPIDNFVEHNTVRSNDENKYKDLILEKRMTTFSVFLFKYSFMDVVSRLKDLADSENRLQNGKSTKNEIAKLGEACGLKDLASIQPTSSPGTYQVLHNPKIFFKLEPILISISGIDITLSADLSYGYNRGMEYCMEEEIRFEQDLNLYICKEIATHEPPCMFATLSDHKDSCEFTVTEADTEKNKKANIFGFEHNNRYYLVKTNKKMGLQEVNRTVISKIYKYFLSVQTLQHELGAVEVSQNLTLEKLQKEVFRSKEILFGLLVAIVTNLIFILSVVLRKCIKSLKKCIDFILSRTANNDEEQGGENDLAIPLRVRRASRNRDGSSLPSVRFEEI